MIKSSHLILICLAGLLLLWLTDAALDAWLFQEGTFWEQVVNPGTRELWMRSNLLVFLLGFLVFFTVYIRRREALSNALQRALEQADTERAKVEAILAAIGDGLSIQDTDFRVLYQNEVHKKLAGGDFLGEKCYQAYDCRDSVCPGCPVAASYLDGQIHKLVKKMNREGAVTHIEITASPLRNGVGEIIAGIELVRDISLQVQARTSLEQHTAALAAANHELKSFSYSVSHDVRKPLTIIYTAAQTLQEQLREEHGDASYLVRVICDASCRMEELIDALQILSQVSQGAISHSEVDLSACALEIRADLQMVEPSRSVEWQITPGLTVQGDGRLLRLLLENLIGNAWKYSRNNPHARIELGEAVTDHGRTFFVRDNGAGFDMARIDQLFRPFVRLHSGEEFPGTGVGLATVQRIVQRHRGKVWGEGAVGQGATFLFTLGQSPQGLAGKDLTSAKEGQH